MSRITIFKLVKSMLAISSNKQASEINSAGQLCVNSWLSIIMHLPLPDGDLIDWQRFNNWKAEFKSKHVCISYSYNVYLKLIIFAVLPSVVDVQACKMISYTRETL